MIMQLTPRTLAALVPVVCLACVDHKLVAPEPRVDVTGSGVSVRPLFFDGNIVYNWEGGQWHPYVTGGVGFYRYHVERGSAEADDKNAGLDLGGGFEYFFTRRATITGELLYHKVGEVVAPPLVVPDGSFWTFAIGAKAYFGR